MNENIRRQKPRDLETNFGQVFAFIISILAITGGMYTALHGFQAAAVFISVLGLTGLVSSFITADKKRKIKSDGILNLLWFLLITKLYLIFHLKWIVDA